MTALKDDWALFSRLYIACQSREGNWEFFKHENHPWPPSLAQASRLKEGQKSDLVKCMEKASALTAESPPVDFATLDGAVVVQMASAGAARTFQEYADNVFTPYIMTQLQPVKRVDIIWNVYQQDSLKAATRERTRPLVHIEGQHHLPRFRRTGRVSYVWMRTRQSYSTSWWS